MGLDLRCEDAPGKKCANFTGADLNGVDFTDARLEGATFADADLRGADFTGADLERADFASARLRDAQFAFASANGRTSFQGADLRDVVLKRLQIAEDSFRDLPTGVVLHGACWNDGTSWPEHGPVFTPPLDPECRKWERLDAEDGGRRTHHRDAGSPWPLSDDE